MSSRCKRSGIANMLMPHPGVSDDGHSCTAGIYDLRTNGCQRLLRSFSTEYRQGSYIRACKYDRVTWTIALLDLGEGDVFICADCGADHGSIGVPRPHR